jgi:sulfite exporter TauE/SafE
MAPELTLVAALTAGLLGSGHCLGMCGGIAGALGASARTATASAAGAAWYALVFNLGRVCGYALIGALAGLLGGGLVSMADLPAWSATARGLTGLLMVMIGLQIAFRWSLLGFIERSGARFWARLAPLARRLLPARTPFHALLLGILWGWLPCGLVYSILIMALLTGNALHSALLMAVFGLGTLPSMTLTGLAGARLQLAVQRPGLRLVAGLLLVGLGLWTGLGPLRHLVGDHEHHHAVARTEIAGLL